MAGIAVRRRHTRCRRGLRRARAPWLDDDSWVDVAPAWLHGSDARSRPAGRADRVASAAGHHVRSAARRATAHVVVDGRPGPRPARRRVGRRLVGVSARYERRFDSLGANLYRDGRDSVAWHSDRIGRTSVDPVVVIVSLGQRPALRSAPQGGGPARTLLPGRGDLFVMGGRCQHDWEHGVPKVAAAGPRLSLTFRHGAERPDRSHR